MPENFTHGYALLIGVGCTQAPGWSLPVTVKDARAMHVLLTDPARCAYPAQAVRLLHDAGATRAAILDGLAWLSGRALTDPQATAVVYVSGHGLEHTTGHYVLVPHDFDPDDAVGSGLAAAGFTAALRAVRARRLLVIVDTCHAAGMTLGAKSKGDGESPSVPPDFTPAPLPKGYVDTLAEGEGRAVFTASRGAQKSWVRPDGVLSVFTYHMLEALQGAGNRPGDTRVKVSNLMRHLGEAVPQSARRIGVQQTPFFKFETEDFPVALLRGGKGLPAGGWPAAREEATDAIARVINQVTVDGGSVAAVGDQARAANGGGVAAGDVGGSIATGDHAIAANGPVTVHQDESTHIGIQAGHIDAQNVVQGTQILVNDDDHESDNANREDAKNAKKPSKSDF